MKPPVVSYRNYKDFHNETFKDSLRYGLNVQGQFLNGKGLDAFSTICTEMFDKHAPKKKRYIRYNHKLFINNEISKAIMTKSRLRNRFIQNRSKENRKLFCKQRKKCVSVPRKSKKDHFGNLTEKNLLVKKKKLSSERINLTEEENSSLLTNCKEVIKELNNFFANTAKNLNIPNYENCDSLAENIDDPTLKAIAKWRKHTSILAITSAYKNRANFPFNFGSKEDVLTEIKMLDVSKAIEESDIPVKINRGNDNFFEEAIFLYFNKSLENGKFPNCLKLANIT